MNIRDKQAESYIEEAKLSIESAKASLQRARESEKELWHSVVKLSYDAMEQAVSAVLAKKGESIPKSHPGKIEKFVNQFGESEITQKLYRWLGKRSRSQYVDIEKGEITVPHKNFTEEDAENSLKDAELVIEKIENKLDSIE